MKTLRFLLLLSPIFLVQACGAPSTSTERKLVSITVSPTSATASGAAGGQVQFVATGHYNTEPYTVTPLDAKWGACPNVATVTQTGLATCAEGASGTTSVAAWVVTGGPVCNAITCTGQPCGGNIGANAELTCP